MNGLFELPSLEEIEQMDRSQAIESLQITNSSVKCQRCGTTVPIVGKLTKISNDRIDILQKRIRWMENYRRGTNTTKDDDLKALKQELAEFFHILVNSIIYRAGPTAWLFTIC